MDQFQTLQKDQKSRESSRDELEEYILLLDNLCDSYKGFRERYEAEGQNPPAHWLKPSYYEETFFPVAYGRQASQSSREQKHSKPSNTLTPFYPGTFQHKGQKAI